MSLKITDVSHCLLSMPRQQKTTQPYLRTQREVMLNSQLPLYRFQRFVLRFSTKHVHAQESAERKGIKHKELTSLVKT